MRPSEFVSLPREEKAFIIACIAERIAAEKKEAARMKTKRK
jgi:hypothetical protein